MSTDVVTVAESLLAEPLNALVTAVLDSDVDPDTRTHLNAAANHVSLALTRLARIQTPARLAPSPTGAGATATRGGPAQDLARSVEGPASGIAQVERVLGVGLAEGRHRLVGACTLPDGTPPFPGSPPTPPPPSPRS